MTFGKVLENCHSAVINVEGRISFNLEHETQDF